MIESEDPSGAELSLRVVSLSSFTSETEVCTEVPRALVYSVCEEEEEEIPCSPEHSGWSGLERRSEEGRGGGSRAYGAEGEAAVGEMQRRSR